MLCIAYCIILLPPIAISAWYQDGELPDFIKTMFTMLGLGLLLWLPTRKRKHRLRRRDGFLIVAVFWVILSAISAMPFMLGPHHLGVIDSLFEATSAITTTGATIIPDLNLYPPSILFYRQELQWVGGIGLVVIAIAVLPMLGVGGSGMYQAETPGPMKDNRLTPRIAQTAQKLWKIYVGLTIACALAYWMAGMNTMDAIQHSFSTISTGGFSPYNESLGYFNNPRINNVAVVFMILGGINFSIHFLALRNMRISDYLADEEVRTFLKIIIAVVTLYTITLYGTGTYDSVRTALHVSLFEVVSVITSTGLGITDFSLWPGFLPVMLIFISFIGGCGGSTAGGIKVMRVLTLFKQGLNAILFLIHPRAVRPVRIGNTVMNEHIMQSIWGFASAYIVIFVLFTLAMMLAGLDQVTAFTAVATCINNLGPGLGNITANFSEVSDSAKILGMFAMIMGRLEIFTLLIIMMPAYWRE